MLHAHKLLSKRILQDYNSESLEVTSDFRGTYKSWTDPGLSKALAAIDEGFSIRKVAEMYGIPKSTLHDHVSGKVAYGSKCGPDPYLDLEEEEELANFLVRSAGIGYPHTKKQVFALVQRMLNKKGIETNVTNGWWERFQSRHPHITTRVAVPLSVARAKASDPVVLKGYFDMLEECLKQNKIFDKPGCIFNCDESGIPLNPRGIKIVDQKGSKYPSHFTSGDKSQLTVMACTCAAGYFIPPMIIFDRKKFINACADGEVPGTLYGLLQNGWINSQQFYGWFQHFLEYAPQKRPLLLLLDGHSTHYCPETIKLAAESNIVICALPPHTTHIVQPLDRGCFAPLKVAWKQECHEFYTKNPGRVVTRLDFNCLFAKAWYKAMTAQNIISSYKVTGVYPFNREVVCNAPGMETKEKYSMFKPGALAKRTGLAYIPLYSPSAKPKPPSFGCDSSVFLQEKLLSEHSIASQSSITEDSSSGKESSDGLFYRGSIPLQTATSISEFLKLPEHPSKMSTEHQKSVGSILTSADFREKMEKLEMEKLDKINKKRLKKVEQGRKRQQRDKIAKLKKALGKRKTAASFKKASTKKATKSSEPVKQHTMHSKNNTESFSENQEIVSESLSEAKLNEVLGRKKPAASFKKVSTKKATKVSEPIKQYRMDAKHSDESLADDQKIISESFSESFSESLSEVNLNKALGRKKTATSFKKVSTKKATKVSKPVKQCRMQSKHSDESFSDDQEIILQSISEAKQKKLLGRKKTTAQLKKVNTKKATEASKPVKQHRRHLKQGDESFSDDQEITSKSLSEVSNDSVDDKNLNKSIKGGPSMSCKCFNRGKENATTKVYFTRASTKSKATTEVPVAENKLHVSRKHQVKKTWKSKDDHKPSSELVVLSDNEASTPTDCWIEQLHLYATDYEALQTKEITGNIVNAAQSLLQKQFPLVQGLQDTVLAHHLKFIPIKPDGLSVQVLHTGAHHWLCVCHIPGNKVVHILDSLIICNDLNSDTIFQICKIYSSLSSKKGFLKLQKLSVQQQINDRDCGLFAIANTVEICFGNNPEDLSYDQDVMRNHIEECFTNKEMEPFPKSLKPEILPRPERSSTRIQLYCVCQMPENYDDRMICCEKCDMWYHYSCIKLETTPQYWGCRRCTENEY